MVGAAVALASAPLLLLGPGTDLDVGAVIASGRSLVEHHRYRASRPPGAPVHELGVGILQWVGGTVASNVGSFVCAAVVVGAVVLLLQGATYKENNTFSFEAGQAAQLESDQLPHADASPTIGIIYRSPALLATDPAFRQGVEAALAPALHDARVRLVTTPWNAPPAASPDAPTRISRDNHALYVVLTYADKFDVARAESGPIVDEVTTPQFQVTTFGTMAIIHDEDRYLAGDLKFGALVSLPVALLLLVVIFGSLSAALVCIGVGMAGVAGGLAGMGILSHITNVSPYASDIVGLVGLGVGIDYSLFIVSRFREELARGRTPAQAIETTMSTAGRAITFSGITVAVGLSGMLFFPHTFLVSMGLAGAIVVATSVLFGLTLLPALLALLGPRINRFSVPFAGRGHGRMWRRIAEFVMRRPVTVLVPTVAVLLLLGSPFPGIKLANADVNVLPPSSPARLGTDQLASDFAGQGRSQIDVVMTFASGSPYDSANVAAAFSLNRRLAATPGVMRVTSYVGVQPNATLAQYQALYAHGKPTLPDPAANDLLTSSTGSTIAVLVADTGYLASSDDAAAVLHTIRSNAATPGARVLVDGDTAFNVDFVDFIVANISKAVIYVTLATFLILLLLLRSIVLPLKAVVMNLLSLSAAFGAMVWVFQQGHLSGMLTFAPGPLDPSIPVLLFCIVFGLSMDYEVFLMTRMQEAWEDTHDNRRAVADGLQASGRLVTGAAAIMVCVFSAFAFGQVVLIKSIGVGMAVAVFCDATMVRALVVPALMRLLGSANWWAPKWMRRRGATPAH